MRNLAIAFILAAIISLISCGSYSGTSIPAAPVQTQPAAPAAGGTVFKVAIKSFAFSPATITIKKGDAVSWTNEDSSAHTATGPGFDSGTLGPGKSYSYTFNDAGSKDYICSLHPSMRAMVVVQP